ncbi:hypothetical protein Ait01nite_031310 [Actinoplanes italicus]|uniref:Uncharacterized protein n=2 Tax=Actinoplanes italicus TaxID=113567 RepID=A0A2T0KJ89_9ACTN|nr:hypothetical protein CLV67_103336 [Actinoplanes italicus]GIE30086.1 hypothetical protein Ait01nite_031310 [Actinoplanes italicus]
MMDMSKLRMIALVAAGAAAFVGINAGPASAQAPVAVQAAWPVAQPKCAHLAPEGAVFVTRVQPPFGLGYDVWRLTNGQTVNIYC